MEVEYKTAKDYTINYLKNRDKLSLVVKYLDALKTNKPDKQVNDDCVRMLMEVLKMQSEMYLDLNYLPIYNAELEHQNHVLKVENEKLLRDNIMLTKKIKL